MKNNYNSSNYTTLVGKTITITGIGSNHGYGSIGSKVKVCAVYLHSSTAVRLNNSGAYINFTEFTAEPVTRKEIAAEVTELEIKISDLKSKVEFMDAQKLDSFDDNKFKVFAVLQELKTSSSDIDKAKAIAKLINQ